MRLKKCVWASCKSWCEMRSVSCQMAVHSRHVAWRWKKALSVTWSRVRETTKLSRRLDRSRVSSQRRTSSDTYCGAVPRLISSTQFELNSAWHWQPVELLQERWCMRPGRSLAAASCTRCRRWSADWQLQETNCYNNPSMTVSVHVSAYTVCHSQQCRRTVKLV